MTRSTVARDAAPGSRSTTALTALRVLAVLCTVELLYQFATAGQVLMRGDEVVEWHGGGAIALHVLTGLLTLAAVWYARSTRGSWWPAAVSGVVFAASFVEASLGHEESLWIHVPLALVLTVGIVWVTAWSFTAGARVAR